MTSFMHTIISFFLQRQFAPAGAIPPQSAWRMKITHRVCRRAARQFLIVGLYIRAC